MLRHYLYLVTLANMIKIHSNLEGHISIIKEFDESPVCNILKKQNITKV